MVRRNKTKRTPTAFLVFVLILISYGFVVNKIVNTLPNSSQLLPILNSVNITLTIAWLIFNCFMIFFFFKNNYESEAKGLSIYYVLINSWNLSNILFGFITDFNILFWFSIFTKTIELFIILRLLIRNLKSRYYFSKV